jgi:hypothetical protein
VLIAIGRLDAPAAISLVSSDPSFKTTRCVMLSMLCHTTSCPAGNVAGLGEKDCAPLMATTLIVTVPPGGVGVGAGVVGVGVGDAGVAPELVELLPHPQVPRLNATMTLAVNTRILVSLLLAWLSLISNIHTTRCSAPSPRRSRCSVTLSSRRQCGTQRPGLWDGAAGPQAVDLGSGESKLLQHFVVVLTQLRGTPCRHLRHVTDLQRAAHR